MSEELLVSVLRKVVFADTMRAFNQVLRFDYKLEEPLKVQLCFDRVNKFTPSLSKPVAYFTIDSVQELEAFAINSITAASVMALRNKPQPSSYEIGQAVDSLWTLIRSDIINLVDISLAAIRERRVELSKKRLPVPQIQEEI